jgi:hydroxypyruvate reductase
VRGVQATRAILDLVADLGASDVMVALISGGGSALLEAPRLPVTLDDLARTTDLLLRAGAPIEDLNAVRRSLSLVKAGGLLRAAAPASVITIILSDVLGNDPQVIASGATVAGQPEAGVALNMLDRYRVRGQVPDSVIAALDAVPDEPISSLVDSKAVVIIGDNAAAVTAAANAAKEDGFAIEIVAEAATGEASKLGLAWVDRCRTADGPLDVVLGGGEATVTVRGDGVGGRNTEFALAAALALVETETVDWVVASLATDGEDGPTMVAGAIADSNTVNRAAAAGVDVQAALANNDSLRVFEAAGGLVRPGPTGTNVNDLYFAVRVMPTS